MAEDAKIMTFRANFYWMANSDDNVFRLRINYEPVFPHETQAHKMLKKLIKIYFLR
jgi:hypothetical protein